MAREAEALSPPPGVESFTVSVKDNVPGATGVPVMIPVAGVILKPGGNPVADQVYGGVPPLAVAAPL